MSLTPKVRKSQYTMAQVKAAGFLYDSSLMSSDDAYEILMDQQPTGVIELPKNLRDRIAPWNWREKQQS